MKKVLSVIMALVMSVTTLFALPAAVQADQNYDTELINKNIDFVKSYVKGKGFINGNGEYTIQHTDVTQSIRYYGLFLVDPKNNSLTFDYQRCDAFEDKLYTATTLEILNASQDMLKVWVDFWVMSDKYADLSGYAYIDRNFNHNNKKPVFYIEKNDTNYPDSKAIEMCEENFTYAFNEWCYMMDEHFAMDMSAIGFHSYCQKHVYGYNAPSCMMCGFKNPNYSAASSNAGSTDNTGNTNNSAAPSSTAKPKATTLSKVTAGKKQFKASWKKLSGVTGYQIQYSTDKKFKKGNKTVTVKGANKASVTVKKLKSKKTYYVRIRTCKGKSYSAWSKAKTVKVK